MELRTNALVSVIQDLIAKAKALKARRVANRDGPSCEEWLHPKESTTKWLTFSVR